MVEKEPARRQQVEDAPLWKTFLTTDLERIERVSGELQRKAQPSEEMRLFNFELYEKPPVAQEEKKPELKAPLLSAREVMMRPVVPFGSLTPDDKLNAIPSHGSDFAIEIGQKAPHKPGILASRLREFCEPKRKEG